MQDLNQLNQFGQPHDTNPQMFSFMSDQGVPWNAKIVLIDQPYGLKKCLINKDEEPYVEFYDARYDELKAPGKFDPEGQFVSRYFLSTFLGIKSGRGLDLQGDVASWKISAVNVLAVKEWVREYLGAKCPQKDTRWS